MLINPYQFGSQLWTPSQITTALWLDAADASTVTTVSGAVSQWNDKSGNNFHATQSISANQPSYINAVLNGRNIIRNTNGTTQSVVNTSGTLLRNVTGWTLYFVGSMTGTGSVSSAIVVRTGAGNTRAGLFKSATNVFFAGGRRLDSDGFQEATSSANMGTNYNILTANASLTNTLLTIRRNGAQEAQNATWLTSGTTPSTGGDYNCCTALGDTCEIIVVPQSVSTGISDRLEGYLAHKWGLTANLPSNHPYKTNPPGI